MKSQNDSSRAPTDLGRFFGHPFPNTGHWLAILFHRRPNGAGGSDTSAAEQKTYVTRTLRLYWSIPSGSNGMFFQFRHKTVHVHEKHTERRNMGKWTSYFEESLLLSLVFTPVDTGVEPSPTPFICWVPNQPQGSVQASAQELHRLLGLLST